MASFSSASAERQVAWLSLPASAAASSRPSCPCIVALSMPPQALMLATAAVTRLSARAVALSASRFTPSMSSHIACKASERGSASTSSATEPSQCRFSPAARPVGGSGGLASVALQKAAQWAATSRSMPRSSGSPLAKAFSAEKSRQTLQLPPTRSAAGAWINKCSPCVRKQDSQGNASAPMAAKNARTTTTARRGIPGRWARSWWRRALPKALAS
mmetsp:Transcript_15490/g.42767  ORF Transcript_15490/g.42767 Transcript_15490/m.42767 type:complete len:216 (-) Transcript_15490:22-669(-)